MAFRRHFLENKLEKLDAVVTCSSVEHSALCRFGDMLNPLGNIITITRAWCDGGSLTIGVPYHYEHELIRFNADSRCGTFRYP